MSDPAAHTLWIKGEAERLGFLEVRMSKAEHMTPEARRLEEWLSQGRQGAMSYLERHFDLRTDPRKLVPGAKSVITLAYNYYTEQKQSDPQAPKLSMYAYGEDYHLVIRRKLNELLENMRSRIGQVEGRGFVDSAPVLERDWARRSGAGWVGKNTMLIHPKKGSYFFLAALILDLELIYDTPMEDYCGTCRRCIEACPTEAISPQGYIMDGSRCISYLTIELKEAIPAEFKDKMDNWMFGCDVCQQVCPWNRFSKPHEEPAFQPLDQLLEMSTEDWLQLSETSFRELFKKSAVKRTKFSGLQRNIQFLQPPTEHEQ